MTCVAGVANVDLTQGAIISTAIVLTFGYTATDGAVYVLSFIHHTKKPPLKVKAVCAKLSKIIDIFLNLL